MMNHIKSTHAAPLQFGEKVLSEFLQIHFIKNNASIARETTYFLSRLRDKDFKVAVVGEFSSGKSTFLNAIIGKDYLTHGVKETTAAVTMLVNTENQGLGRITFSDGTQKNLENYNQLREVTTTQSSAYQVSSQIDLVELFVPFMDTKIPIVLVDTPGLNGVAAMHRERTIDIIQSVHACIYMLQSRGLSETDQSALRWMGQYQQEIIIIQNFIDDINQSEGDTLEELLSKQRKILEENIFSGYENLNYTVCGVSAMKALAAKDTSIERLYSTDTAPLTEADRQSLYSESNFEQAMDCIVEFMEHSFQCTQLTTLRAAYQLLNRTFDMIKSQFEIQSMFLEKSDDAQIILRSKQLLVNWEARRIENEKKLDNFIVSKMNECRKLTIIQLRHSIEESKKAIPCVYEKVATPEDWDEFSKSKVMESKVADETNKIKRCMEEFFIQGCENTHNLAIQRIEEYSGLSDLFSNQLMPKFQARIDEKAVKPFSREEDAIAFEKSQLQALQCQKITAEHQKSKLRNTEQQLSSALNQERQNQNRLQSNFNSKKRSLGEKPEAKVYYEDVPYLEYRGGLGVMDAIFGPKEKTRREERKDYTAQNEWIDGDRKIRNEYSVQKTELNSRLNSLELQLNSAKQKMSELDTSMDADAARMNRKSTILSEMIQSLQMKRALAAKEYVQRQKEKLRDSVFVYLSDTFEQSITNMIDQEVIQIKDHLSLEIRGLYRDIARNQKENLEQMVKENRSEGCVKQENLKRDMGKVLELKSELEAYLCNS